MKLRLLIRLAVIVSIVLLCTGFGMYSFFRLNAAEKQKEFNLYSLVPPDAMAVLETDRMADLVEDINQLNCSKENHFLYVSDLFVYLKKYLHTLVENTPHGLSKQMNKMMISFHEPDTPLNQVLYCTLGAGDYELVESFIHKYCSSTFPSKFFDYEGHEIRIYSMSDGRFLACYFTSDFLAVSFQKRLIEQVIDAHREKKSLLKLPSFQEMQAGKRHNVTATVYVRMKAVDMGKTTDDARTTSQLGNWAEFDLKFKDDAIYCSGISHEVDSARTFINALRLQKPVEGFSGTHLPSSTFFHDCWALSDKRTVFHFTALQEYDKTAHSDYVKQRDKEWIAFLETYGGESVMSCVFYATDTLHNHPCAVMSIQMYNELEAERQLRALLRATPEENDTVIAPPLIPNYVQYPKARKFKQYRLPRNTLFTQMTGITESALYTFACFYRGHLLVAPDAVSLSAYIDAIENGNVLDGDLVYEESIGSLSPTYNFLMMADMKEMIRQPETYVRLIPNFFFRQANFFQNFFFAVQFTSTDGVVYPNIVLLYKGSSK